MTRSMRFSIIRLMKRFTMNASMIFQTRLLLKIAENLVRFEASFDTLISKSD